MNRKYVLLAAIVTAGLMAVVWFSSSRHGSLAACTDDASTRPTQLGVQVALSECAKSFPRTDASKAGESHAAFRAVTPVDLSPDVALTCQEFNNMGPSATDSQALLAQPASPSQVAAYKRFVAGYADAIEKLEPESNRAATLKVLIAGDGLIVLVRESLGMTRDACFLTPSARFDDVSQSAFNTLLDGWGKPPK